MKCTKIIRNCFSRFDQHIGNCFSRFDQHIGKHPCCCVFLMLPLLFFVVFFDIFLVQIITPYRCDMWKGKELEVFLTPEEWRKLSGVNESLKETEWIHYPAIEEKAEKDPFFIKNQGLYQPVMYFNGNKHSLSSVNNKYPYLNWYSYINPTKIFGHNTFVLYDNKLKKTVFQYHFIAGYFENPLSGLAESFECNENGFSDAYKLRQNYLH